MFLPLARRSNTAAHFCLLLEVALGGGLPQKVVFAEAVEIGVPQCLSSRKPVDGGHAEELFEEIESFGRHFSHILLLECVKGVYFGEAHAEEALVLAKGFLVGCSQSSQCFLNEVELVELVFARSAGGCR